MKDTNRTLTSLPECFPHTHGEFCTEMQALQSGVYSTQRQPVWINTAAITGRSGNLILAAMFVKTFG